MQVKKFDETFNVVWWEGQEIGSMIALDTETELIKHKGHIPQYVLGMAYSGGKDVYLIKAQDLRNFMLTHHESTIAFHNATFDIKVIEKEAKTYFKTPILKNKIKDTAILYRLIYLALEGYEPFRWSLDHCVKEMYGEELPKDDDIRLTFGQYIKEDGTIDYDNMSLGHLEYAALDPVATWYVWQKLNERMKLVPSSNECNHLTHLLGDIALDKIQDIGIGVDLDYVDNLRNTWQEKMNMNAKVLATYGLVRGQKGFQDRYEDAVHFLGLDLPKTAKSGKISMSREDLEPYKHEPFVKALLEYLELEKLKNFLNDLTESRVHPRYTSIKKTGRTSCARPNIQNPPREGGVREAFVPAPGKIFIDIDYSSIELYALAQTLKDFFGYSVLFEKLSQNADVHIYAASKIFDKPEEEVTKEERQIAKICNYGLAANMSPNTFQRHMATQGVELTVEKTKEIKNLWADAFPEIRKFWKRGYGRHQFVSKTGFVRNHCSYTQYLNLHFQSVVAEGAKIALYFVQEAGYEIVIFCHDAIVVEYPKEGAEGAMKHITQIMIDAMQKVIPELPIQAEGIVRDRYGK